MIREDLSTEFRDAFEQRAYRNSDAARYEQEQSIADADASRQRNELAGADFLKRLGLGDTIPSPADYDYGRMLADGVHPRPDQSGRLPLPPRYFRPGRLVIGGMDVATGRRVLSRTSLEDRVLSGSQDEDGGSDDVSDLLDAALDDQDSELSAAERSSLGAWRDQLANSVMLASNEADKQTMTDAPQAMIGEIQRNPMQEAIGNLGAWVQRMAEELDRYGITIPLPGGGEANPTLKDVTLGDLGKVIEDISYGFYPVKGSGMTMQAKPEALELLNVPAVAGAAGVAVKAAKAMPRVAAGAAIAAGMSADGRGK